MKAMNLTSLAACALAVCAAGCASNVQFVRIPDLKARVEDSTKGRVYLFRPSGMGTAVSMEIWDGNVHIGNTGSKSFLCWEREPGEAIISGREENVSTVPIWIQTNQVYYVFQHMRMGWIQARNELEVVPEEEAAKLLKKCKAPKPGNCKDHPECRAQPGTENGL